VPIAERLGNALIYASMLITQAAGYPVRKYMLQHVFLKNTNITITFYFIILLIISICSNMVHKTI
jgi:hypothetical protein